MESFARVVERDGGQTTEAADVVGMEMGQNDGGEFVSGEGLLGEGEGEESAIEAGGEAAGFREVGAIAGVEQDKAGLGVAEGGNERGQGDLLEAAGAVDEPGALAAVATGVEREVDVGHRLQATTGSWRTGSLE